MVKMAFSIPSWAKPALTVVYGITGYIVTEIPVLLGYLPATIDGHSTAGIVAGLGFVASAAYWLHSHLKQYISSSAAATAPAASSPSISVSAASSGPAPAPSVPSSVPAGAIRVTSANAAYQTAATGTKTPNAPIGSYVVDEGNGWYDVYDSNGNLSVRTRINPLSS